MTTATTCDSNSPPFRDFVLKEGKCLFFAHLKENAVEGRIKRRLARKCRRIRKITPVIRNYMLSCFLKLIFRKVAN